MKSIAQLIPPSLSLAVIALVALTVSGCGKSERELTTEDRLKSVQQRQETQPEFFAPRNRVDYMADLKNLKDAPAAEKGKPAEGKSAAPIPSTPVTAPIAPPVAAPISQAPRPTTPAPVAQTQAIPAPVVPVAAPAPQAAVPSRAADASVTVVSREAPTFPREAIRQGIESGVVRARATINAAGEVTAVTIVSARPARVFDREVQTTFGRWRFNPGADGRSYETEINFQR